MSAPRTTIWPISELAPIKHLILRKYLERWFIRMLPQHERLYVFDCFCGPGKYTGGEIGSPLIALEALLHCTTDPEQQRKVIFVFRDKRNDRCNLLQRLLYERKQLQHDFSSIKYYIEQAIFASNFHAQLLDLQISNNAFPPAFIFIDPFGFAEIPMSVISGIMRHQHCEVLITFMFEELNRFLTYSNKSFQQRLTKLFATEAWKSIDLYGNREQQITDLYCKQLCRTNQLSQSCLLRLKNSKNITDYFLIFGTHHHESIKAMGEIFYEIDPIGGSNYSQFDRNSQKKQAQQKERAQIANQLYLFSPDG
jgi:three-Cys-motif partner protein